MGGACDAAHRRIVDFHIGGEVVRLGPGGLAIVPPNVMHHAVLVGDKPALNLDVFAPAPLDYLG
jgi:quercetin dioxygenase-like cupin family protein